MYSALIVSGAEKDASLFAGILNAASVNKINTLNSAGEARRLLFEQDFDLVIVNPPLPDEPGEELCRYIASKDVSQVIFVVKNENFDAVSAVCGEDGVLVISKPVNKDIFWSALSLAKSMGNRMKRMQAENERLKQKIEDIRIVSRAKLILVSGMNLSEQEAHRYIEKQAMDLRSTRRAVADRILKKFEN